MPVGFGSGQVEGHGRGMAPAASAPATVAPARLAGPSGFHPLALWIAAGCPVAATLMLLSRLAA